MKRLSTAVLLTAVWLMPVASIAQTRIIAPKNKYKVQDDVKLGNDAARQVEQQFPLINDRDAEQYLQSVGERLVAAIPREFYQSSFDYRFKWVNASDINAFALPGGPMYVNRGMLEAARNEGEMAGVMAHEISHVALRHATAQATKQQSAKNTLGTIGLILGGAILGGQTGAQLGGLGAAAWMTKYSREYESQADTLGARIMADAGYDPHDLANVFQTIQQQSGGRGGPQWLSSHPDPGNRFNAINREAQLLNVSRNPIKLTRDFERIKSRFRSLPRAPTMAEIERGAGGGPVNNGGNGSTTSNGYPGENGRYTSSVAAPSSRMQAYTGADWMRASFPSNWANISDGSQVQFAPQGAYGNQGITRGVMMGVYSGSNRDLETASEEYLNGVLSVNSYLRQRGSLVQTTVAGRRGFTTSALGVSPVTGRTELVNVYTTQLSNGGLFYAITVVPQDESYAYSSAFRNVINSIQLYDR
jgi:hypothetical protein